MSYTIRKAKCKQTDGDRGSYVLSYTDKDGVKHRNCNITKSKANAQISAIEMGESMEEGWVPVAARLTALLEEELAALAGSFMLHEDGSKGRLKVGARVRPKFISAEMMTHTNRKVPHGKILVDNGDGTYDVEWDSLDKLPVYLGDEEDEVSSEPEDNVQRRVRADEIIVSKPRRSSRP